MRTHKIFTSLLLLMLGIHQTAFADFSGDQVRLAASGRFDLLESSIEDYAKTTPLKTRDLHALCFAYSKTKRYSQLQQCLDQLETKIQAGDRRTLLFGLHDATPALHLMRAEAMIELGQYATAIDHANKALTWLTDDDSDDLDLFANALSALSIAHAFKGNTEQAWNYEKQLLKLKIGMMSDYASAKAVALARTRMALQDYRGVIDAIQGDATFGVNVFLDKLFSGSFFTGTNNWVWAELPRAFMLNKALLETGRTEEAKAGFDKLLGIRQVQENGEIYWLLLSDRGRIAEEAGQFETALSLFRQAIDVVETQRANINTEASKIGFVGDKQALYGKVVKLAHRLQQPKLALEYMERSKSRALVDLLAARNELTLEAARDDESKRVLKDYYAQQSEASVQRPIDMQAALSKTRTTLSSQASALRQQNAELASLVTVQALSSQELVSQIAADEVLLEFFSHGNVFFGLIADQKESLLLEIKSAQLEADIREFRKLIQDQSPLAAALASKLYGQLIAPFEKIIGQRNLLIIPHGPLHYLPFSALNDGKQVLIAQRSLRFLPSNSVQQYIAKEKNRNSFKLLIFGNPDLGKAQLDLPSAEEEAKAIAKSIPQSELLTRKNATESAFKQKATQFNYLHIASHGQFKAENALDSRLLLASDVENDGSLTVRELYQLNISADLVTLSACETGLGSVLNGDDILGLTRGFLYAGSRNIVASLWEVDDEATSLLMQGFYSRLQQGKSKKAALREAQLQLQKTHPDPFYWSAFYLTGAGT
ncbi:CHAT domain-containing protein [Azonexus sp.]|uniref:CHAT domain-containing protein n=1 Tax=Azonexus sp. TaxID=1872668 RepID=UPI0027B9992D|nr:CHAT domain-containing protein [Azonexus sp.]